MIHLNQHCLLPSNQHHLSQLNQTGYAHPARSKIHLIRSPVKSALATLALAVPTATTTTLMQCDQQSSKPNTGRQRYRFRRYMTKA
jgi:hypothetical protein